MTEPLDATARFGRPAKGRPTTIDGEATVVARRPGVKSDAEKAAATPVVHASDAILDGERPDIRHFGRRGPGFPSAPLAARRKPDNDILFQARALQRFAASPTDQSRAGGISIFLQDTAGSIPVGGRLAGLGGLALCVLVPLAVLLMPDSPVAAPASGASEAGFVLAELDAGLVARGGGTVLSIEGLVRNISGETAPIPPLRVSLRASDGTVTLRPVATGTRALGVGDSLRFHSAVAVPPGTEGDVSVDFAPRAALDDEAAQTTLLDTGKTLSE